MQDISSFLQSVKLPVMPEVAHALIRTLDSEDAGIEEVRDIIAKDPALTATLLRMANSAMFGLSRTVSSLDNAVSVVGMAQIRARALSVCMANVFSLPPGMNRLSFWRESMTCAGYARWIALMRGTDENQAWLTGMMLRLGQLVIGTKNTAVAEAIEARPRAPGQRWQRERDLVGFDEGQIMAEVATTWDFPDEVAHALRYCANPLDAKPDSDLSGMLHIAALLADHAEVKPEMLALLPTDVVRKLGLNLMWMAAHLPDAETFSDVSMLHG